MRQLRRGVLLASAVCALATTAGLASGSTSELPLGPSGLPEHSMTKVLAPGLTYTRIDRGFVSNRNYWSVETRFQTAAEARKDADSLRKAGFDAWIRRIDERPPDDMRHSPLLWTVRAGRFDTEDSAAAAQTRISDAGLDAGSVVYSGEDGDPSTGPWVIHVVRVGHDYKGRVINALARNHVRGRETPSGVATRTGSLVATNGSFFVITPGTGYLGDLEGVSVSDGRLVSEAINGKSAALLGKKVQIGRVRTVIHAQSDDGASSIVDGLNRPNGKIFGCGGTGGDSPTQRPLATYGCTDESEIIQYQPQFGGSIPDGLGYQAVLNSDGVVQGTGSQGGAIPAGGSVLVGTGAGAGWLHAHAAPGQRVTVSAKVLLGNRVVHPEGALAGGPMLLQHGRIVATGERDGFTWPDYGTLWWSFGVRRNPRTMLGTTANGDVLIVAVDGHDAKRSIGLSVREEVLLMRSLGAVDAINLDGGGSTSMVLGTTVVNRPSDDTGERPVGDALLVMPPAR